MTTTTLRTSWQPMHCVMTASMPHAIDVLAAEREHLTRRENAVCRLQRVLEQRLPRIKLATYWEGETIYNAYPISYRPTRLSPKSIRDGLHVLELFARLGLGVPRTALVAGYNIRRYTYVDKDLVSRHITLVVLTRLHEQYLQQLITSAFIGYDNRLPQNVAHCITTFPANLVAKFGPVGLLGASWECQRFSEGGTRQGINDPRFKYFFNMINIITFFQERQTSPMVYLLENTYPGERCTRTV